MTDSPVLLRIENLTTVFGGLKALSEVSLEINPGQAIGLVGPNGSGKTTLVNTVCGLYRPASGRVILEGTDITGHRPHSIARAGINRTFQIPKPFKDLSVYENVKVSSIHSRNPAPIEEVLARVNLREFANHPISELTASQQKRLDLARALALEPKIIFVDELAAGLTPGELHEVAEMLKQFQAFGIAMIVVEHLMGFLEQVVASVLVLSAGRTIFTGALRNALADEEVKRVFLGGESDAGN
ncbi:MAG: ATP-binding cassette domain-containing protein [Acidimicrobiaceae bacterium]|nr:ATP-binding cassette domain-containing protein [Acidimicrobiaceae bacterium]